MKAHPAYVVLGRFGEPVAAYGGAVLAHRFARLADECFPDEAPHIVRRYVPATSFLRALWPILVVTLAFVASCASSTCPDVVRDGSVAEDLGTARPTVDVEHSCIRAANAYDAADVRLGCHGIASCCTLTHTCPAELLAADVDACVAARAAATSCDDLAPSSCAFSPLFPEAP